MQGVMIGFATAFPLMLIVGPVAILLMEEGLTNGARPSWPAPLAVASVDAVYGSVAAVAGTAAQRILAGHAAVLETIAGAVLVGLAAQMLHRMWGERSAFAATSGPDTAAASAPAAAVTHPVGRPHKLATKFVAITMVNPLTILAFTTLAVTAGRYLSPAWVLGVTVASICAHTSWVLVGDTMGRVLPARGIAVARLVGCLLVLGLGLQHVVR